MACKPLLKIILTLSATSTKSNFVDAFRFCWCSRFLGNLAQNAQKSWFLTQNVEFPALYYDISRRGIERTTLERVSHASPTSFGQMVNFLEKSKNRENRHFQKWPKITVASGLGSSQRPICVQKFKFSGNTNFYEGSCLKTFCLPKYAFWTEIEHPGFGVFGKITKFLDFGPNSTGVYLAPPVAKSIFGPGFG